MKLSTENFLHAKMAFQLFTSADAENKTHSQCQSYAYSAYLLS